jgi:hypothetical protein
MDTNITANVPLFIQLLEAELNDRLLLKNQETEGTLTLAQGQNYVALPSGYVSPIALWLIVDSERVLLKPALPQELPYNTDSTQPEFWAIDGANIRFDCPAGEAYSAKFRYYATSNLSNSNTTNYLLLKRPDVYLYGAMEQAGIFAQNDEWISKYGALKERGIKSLKDAENRSRSIVPLRTDLPIPHRSNIIRGE